MNRKQFIGLCVHRTDASKCGKMSNLPLSFAHLIPCQMQHTNKHWHFLLPLQSTGDFILLQMLMKLIGLFHCVLLLAQNISNDYNNDHNFVYFMAARNRKTLIFIGEKVRIASNGCDTKRKDGKADGEVKGKSSGATLTRREPRWDCHFPNRNDRLKIRFHSAWEINIKSC